MQSPQDIRTQVLKRYGVIAQNASARGCCGGPVAGASGEAAPCFCGTQSADLNLGCGNPTALATLRSGDTVLDLGSGPGNDCFQAARLVGPAGRVIGVDMTPEMIALAQSNLTKQGLDNVEFHHGDIENLPVPNETVDIIISNCVVNLSPNKKRVWAEAYRVLKPGGRISIADMVATQPLPADMHSDLNLISGCVGGAALKDDIEAMLGEAGFTNIRIDVDESSREAVNQWFPGKNAGQYVASAMIYATKPSLEKTQPHSDELFVLGELEAKEVRKKAYRLYESGFHCAEVILQTVLESLGRETSPDLRRAASVFGGGIVATGELCGAFTGGVMAAGYLMGRDQPGRELKDLAGAVKEFKARFIEDYGTLSCPALMEGFKNGREPYDCVRLTARAAVMLVEILGQRRIGMNMEFASHAPQNRGEVPLGVCPFGGCSEAHTD